MEVFIIIFYLWLILNMVAGALMAISNNRLSYMYDVINYLFVKNITGFVLRFVILFAYLPFSISSLIKEVINE